MMEATDREARSLPAIADISRAIVRIHAEHFGRGPTKAKTIWRDDVVLCVLQDIFSKPEMVLVGAGQFDQVRLHRQAFQDAIEPLLRQAVAEATGFQVRTFLSQVSPDGVASELFLLDRSTAG